MIEPERKPDPLSALLHQAVELDESERRLARTQFLERVGHKLQRKPSRILLVRYSAPLALAASLLLVWFFWTQQRGLEFTVQGAVRNGDYVHVSQAQSADIVFSDRTRIHAAAGARLRISDNAGQDGARVSVERGRLGVAVTHKESTNWRFEAGPFRVRVTGTRFELAWDPDSEQLEVILRDGSVNVDGYAGSGSVSVRTGQRFVGDAKRRTMLVADIAGPVGPAEPMEPIASVVPESASATHFPSPSAEPAPKPGPPALASTAPPSRKVSWSALVAKGAYRQVVDEATARGTSECLASGTADELNALADAARYVGRGDLAERTLMALRTRHAATYGTRAAFLLGRLYESRGDMASAKSWYESTLREGAGGAFAAEALAGKMRTVGSLEGRASARVVAREYLRRYPNGVHASAAKQLTESP